MQLIANPIFTASREWTMTNHRRLGSVTAAVSIILFLCIGSAFGQGRVSNTKAETVLSEWVTTFNSADPEKIKSFYTKHSYQPPVPQDQIMTWRAQTGGFTLLRIEKSEPLLVNALLGEKDSDWAATASIALSDSDPTIISSMKFGGVPLPPEFAPPRMTQADALAGLSAYTDKLTKKDWFSGVVLVARNNKILLQKAWGLADREKKTPNTIDTQFRIGSMNKMFTAVATLQLVEAGKLSLDGTVGSYLPDYPNKEIASKVTLRHLLTHTGGTGDIFGPEFDKNRATLKEHQDYLNLYGSRGPDQTPGTDLKYSNYGFVLLGAIIEKVSGVTYYTYVREKIFKPAGMMSTDSLSESVPVPKRAAGYVRDEQSWVSNVDTLPYRGTAAGGGYSTVGDLLRFVQALESGKLLSSALFAEAIKSQKDWYGYGFMNFGEGSLKAWGHEGGAPGINGDLRVFPNIGYVLIALSNFDPPAASKPIDYFEGRMPLTP
jgi:D-alanyl-D-alanine carboxypeptidase